MGLPGVCCCAAVLLWAAGLSVTDIIRRRLPNAATLSGGAVIVAGAALCGRGLPALAGALALGGLYLVVHVADPAALGGGDVKLALGLGGLTGAFGVDVWVLAALGAPLLSAQFPRALIDVNRGMAELDRAMFDGALSMKVDCWHRPRMGFFSCMGFPMWAASGMDAASCVVSVSVTPVYNAADFVCALSQRRMKFTRATDLDCALERSSLSTLKRSFYDEMAASCRCLDAALQRSGYTGSGSCVQPCLWCLSFRPTPHGAPQG